MGTMHKNGRDKNRFGVDGRQAHPNISTFHGRTGGKNIDEDVARENKRRFSVGESSQRSGSIPISDSESPAFEVSDTPIGSSGSATDDVSASASSGSMSGSQSSAKRHVSKLTGQESEDAESTEPHSEWRSAVRSGLRDRIFARLDRLVERLPVETRPLGERILAAAKRRPRLAAGIAGVGIILGARMLRRRRG